jgi:hypothetical protein
MLPGKQVMLDYHYEEQGRRPAVVAVMAVSVFMGALGASYNAPWYFFAPVAFAGLMAAIIFISNKRSGMALSGDSLRLFSGAWSRTFNVDEISRVREHRYSDGQPSLILLMHNGSSERIPGVCFGASVPLLNALRARGIPVE